MRRRDDRAGLVGNRDEQSCGAWRLRKQRVSEGEDCESQQVDRPHWLEAILDDGSAQKVPMSATPPLRPPLRR